MKISLIIEKIFGKTKKKKHEEFLKKEIEKGHVLIINGINDKNGN